MKEDEGMSLPPSIESRQVYLIGGSRSESMRFEKELHQSFSTFVGKEVAKLPKDTLTALKTIYVVHRYPTDAPFNEDEFLKAAGLPNDESIAINHQNRTSLGGLRAVHDAVVGLQSRTDDSSTLVVGAEVFNPNNPDIDFFERRRVLAQFAGLPELETDIGLTSMSANALLADYLLREQEFTLEEIGDLFKAVTCHLEKFAYINPRSYQHSRPYDLKRITPENYEERVRVEGRMKKWPFHVLDSCPISNGAAALVFSNYRPGKDAVRVACCHIEARDPLRSLLRRAPSHSANIKVWDFVWDHVGEAYREWAERNRPIFEIYDSFAYQIPMTLVDMGMCASMRDVLKAFLSSRFDPKNDACRIILNPSGGTKDGHPTGAYHLVKAADCFNLLTRAQHNPDKRNLSAIGIRDEDLRWAFVHYVHVSNIAGVLALERA